MTLLTATALVRRMPANCAVAALAAVAGHPAWRTPGLRVGAGAAPFPVRAAGFPGSRG
jgi:hypothetical protein